MGSLGLPGVAKNTEKCGVLDHPQRRPRWLRDPLGSMGRTGMAKNAEKHHVFGHPKGGQGGQGTPWGPWAALGWPKMPQNTRFGATPGAAKVAKGPLGAHGLNWGGTPWGPWAQLGWPKTRKNTRFWATPRAAKVAKGLPGANGPHWGGQKRIRIRGFGPPQGRPRWPRVPLGSMGRTGVARNA